MWWASEWTAAADAVTPADWTNPAVFVNLGVAGVFLGLFMAGKIHSGNELERVEKANTEALASQKEANAGAMQRLDDQVRQLLLERDRALAERDEMIGVMKDFTLMAGAVLNQDQPWRRGQPPQTPRREPR